MMNNTAEGIPEAGIKYIEKKPSALQWTLMVAFPISLFTVSLFLGRYQVPPNQVTSILGQRLLGLPIETFWTDTVETVVIRVRLPRAIMAALVGAGLSMSGASFQGMFRTPGQPYILGKSRPAQAWCRHRAYTELPAISRGCPFVRSAGGDHYLTAHIYKVTPILMLVLSGMGVNIFQAMLSLKFIADDEKSCPP